MSALVVMIVFCVIANLCTYWMKYPNFEIVEQIQMPKEKFTIHFFANFFIAKKSKMHKTAKS